MAARIVCVLLMSKYDFRRGVMSSTLTRFYSALRCVYAVLLISYSSFVYVECVGSALRHAEGEMSQ